MAGLFTLTGNVFDKTIEVTDIAFDSGADLIKGTQKIGSSLGRGLLNKATLFSEQSDEELQNWRSNSSKRRASALIKADVKFTKDIRKSLEKITDIPEDLPLKDLAEIAKEFHKATVEVANEIISE